MARRRQASARREAASADVGGAARGINKQVPRSSITFGTRSLGVAATGAKGRGCPRSTSSASPPEPGARPLPGGELAGEPDSEPPPCARRAFWMAMRNEEARREPIRFVHGSPRRASWRGDSIPKAEAQAMRKRVSLISQKGDDLYMMTQDEKFFSGLSEAEREARLAEVMEERDFLLRQYVRLSSQMRTPDFSGTTEADRAAEAEKLRQEALEPAASRRRGP